LQVLLVANAGDNAKVAEVFNEALRGDPDEVESFRLCLVNWLADKVVDRLPPLPEEVKNPRAAPEAQPMSDEPVALDDGGNGAPRATAAPKDRLHCDPLTQTVTLDATTYPIADPKAFAVYQAIVEFCPLPLTKADLQQRIPGCKGDKKIRHLLASLPQPVRETVQTGSNGYWLQLKPLPKPSQRRIRKKGRT
jgi:hypothetical protein